MFIPQDCIAVRCRSLEVETSAFSLTRQQSAYARKIPLRCHHLASQDNLHKLVSTRTKQFSFQITVQEETCIHNSSAEEEFY